MSEPQRELPHLPKELTAEVAHLIEQSRRYQSEMTRIQDDLQRIQVKLATISPRRPSNKADE